MAEDQRRLEFATYRKSDLPLVVMMAGGAGGSHHAHCHDFYELVYVHRGGGLHVIQDHPYPMLRGDFYLMRPDDHHSYLYQEELGIFNILFLPELFPEQDWQALLQLPGLGAYLRCDGGSAPHKLALVPDHQRTVEGLCHRMCRELAACEPGWRFAARSSFTQLLVLLSRASATYGQAPSHEDLPPGPVAEAIASIHRHADQPLSVADLAAEVGWTSNYFGERFKQATGLTVQQYIGKLRVDRARILLEDRDRSITDIALEVGFEDPSYFGRVFKQHTGLTPRDYRRLGTARSST